MFRFKRLILLLCPVWVSFGAGRISLKTARVDTDPDWRAVLAEPVKRRHPSRSHLVVELDSPPTPATVRELQRQGVSIAGYISERALVVGASDTADLEGAGIVGAARLRAHHKLSPALAREPSEERFWVLVQFFADVDPVEARALAAELGLEIQENPSLRPGDLLVRARRDRLEQLAEFDEVAYVFPAPESLAAGERLAGCLGAMTLSGPVAPFAARVSEGWDGPGLGSAVLGYFFESLPSRLDNLRARVELSRALEEWARYAALSFIPAGAPEQQRTLQIRFGARNHGDAFPFDGPSGVLAHTFYPSPPTPETLAGDMHFDDDEEWVAGPDLSYRSIDLFSVALHESGHALGLTHVDTPGAVMYPYYRRVTGLAEADIAAIQQLYAAPSSGPAPEPPQAPPAPGPAVPPQIEITSPASGASYSTTVPWIILRGTASHPSGIGRVEWRTSSGSSGIASGTENWTTSTIVLSAGTVAITVVAYARSGETASRQLSVTYAPSGPDTTAPVLQVTDPPSTNVLTAATTISVRGTAFDNVAVTRVVWSTSAGHSGTASGTERWDTGPIPLLTGTNRIIVRAFDAAGNSSWRSLTVTRW
jgi:hypothetical protein